MSSDDKIRGDEFETAIRKAIDGLLEMHALPRRRWKAINLKTFKRIPREIGVMLENMKTGGKHPPINKGLEAQEGDENEPE
jgi:hypothetical protein